MNRQAIQAALGRGAPTPAQLLRRTAAAPCNGSSGTPKSPADAASFSTTASRPASDDRSAPQAAAVDKLAQLSRRLGSNNSHNSVKNGNANNNSNQNNNSNNDGAGQRRGLDSVPGILRRSGSGSGSGSGRTAAIDARALRVSPDAAAARAGPSASSSSSPSSSSSSAPRVLNLRSLRGGLRLSRSPFGSGIDAGEGGGFGRPRFGGAQRAGGGGGGGGRFGGAGGRFGGGGDGGGGSRMGARGRGGRGRRGGFGAGAGRGGGARGRLGKRRGEKDGEKAAKSAGEGKLTWTEEEKAIIDRMEKGEVVPFRPKLTLDSLSGYGAAVATDAPLGQVETALRTMRLMTGGMAFNADSGVTADLTEIMKCYCAKKPFFVHSKGEKEWIEKSNPKLQIVGPNAEMRKAIVDTTILGKYEAQGFAELGDVRATMANYHARTFTYRASDSQKFMDKVLSLLPAQQGNGQAAAQQPKK